MRNSYLRPILIIFMCFALLTACSTTSFAMKELIEQIAKAIVDKPEEVQVRAIEGLDHQIDHLQPPGVRSIVCAVSCT